MIELSEAELLKALREREKELRIQDSDNFYTKGGFWRYCKWWDDSFFFDAKEPLQQLAQILEDMFLEDKYQRLIITVFPRFGKSYIVTMLVTWLYSMNTGKRYGKKTQIMRNSYDDDMAKKFSRDTLAVIRDERYQLKFPHIKMSKRVKEILSWTLQGATEYSYTGSGLDSGITGKGVKDLRILDDPHKGYKEVISEVKSEASWQSYISTHLTRDDHTSNCKDIIIGTRWGVSDIIGRELESRSQDWSVFSFPFLDQRDNSICEAMCSTKRAREIRQFMAKSGQYHIFTAAYQCDPIEAKDVLFKEGSLRYFRKSDLSRPEKKEEIVDKFMFVDFADKGTDYLSAPICVQAGETIYVVDWIFTQDPVESTQSRIVQAIQDYNLSRCIVESNSGGRIFANNIEEELSSDRVIVDSIPTSSNKETRILANAPAIKINFRFLQESERSEEYELAMKQLFRYNKKKKKQKDDAPDSLVGAYQMLETSGEESMLFNY
jgi:predicted phage terminase large subunit-like protein